MAGRGRARDGAPALAARLPIVPDGTVPDGELTTGRFATTVSALRGSKRHRADLGFVVFDVRSSPADLRPLPWQERRDRLGPVGSGVRHPLELSPVVEPTTVLATDITDGRLEGIVLKERQSDDRDGSRRGWWKVKDPRWIDREAWRFDRR